ncbi:siderophore-interacting protein [Mycobacterium sp. PSTR-4-N]|uniref:siderophore-interacting protein n=1 Tax=Mycobacterium sp. PSTR-4-N TaxID=2917745 RepID=UPI001F15577C|nr:siderophore-interacting protein [Mycobacterium sp. PSTR-4-N]MCG7594187.1 siderophore-interacting protein [Mycobacterium sp. PSTR-4-N]
MVPLFENVPLLNTLRDSVFLSATITEISPLTPRMRRIRVSGDQLRTMAWKPGQHIRLQVAGLLDSMLRLHPHDALRTYSIYDADSERGSLDIAMLDHDGESGSQTPARRWASAARVGDHVTMTRPQGSFIVRPDAPYHLFVGEETASVAFAAMVRAVPDETPVYGVVEGAHESDHIALSRNLIHVERGDTTAADSVVLAQAVRELALPDRPGVAYLAGEARTAQTVRRILVEERGWDRRNIRTKPFWTPGRRGME